MPDGKRARWEVFQEQVRDEGGQLSDQHVRRTWPDEFLGELAANALMAVAEKARYRGWLFAAEVWQEAQQVANPHLVRAEQIMQRASLAKGENETGADPDGSAPVREDGDAASRGDRDRLPGAFAE